MKNCLPFLAFFGLAALPFFAFSQERCGSDLAFEMALEKNPSLAQTLLEQEILTQEFIENHSKTVGSRTVVTLPIVVHVVWKNSVDNISDGQIYSQIEVLNQDFRKMNADAATIPNEFKSLAADMEVQFCLATTSPTGQPTTGITRTQTSVADIGFKTSSGGEFLVKHDVHDGKTAWNTSKYINIWVAQIDQGILGWATFPGVPPSNEQGIVVDPDAFGTFGTADAPQNKGRTTTHEMGHFFNLKHIWGESSSTTCLDDDDVTDTPRHAGPNYGCPSHPKSGCSGNQMFQNFMDYVDDGCMSLFTEGQKLRAAATFVGARAGLMTSAGCSLVDAQNVENERVTLFPNPTSGLFWVEGLNEKMDRTAISDVLGRPVFAAGKGSGERLEIDLSALPDGLYFLKIDGATKKILKKTK